MYFYYVQFNGVVQSFSFPDSLFYFRNIIELSVISPPIPLFQWYLQREKILLNLSMKCWNSAFNAQGWRVITVVVQVGAVKIYVGAVEALREKERQDFMDNSNPEEKATCRSSLKMYSKMSNLASLQ
jgi:hypothetical protein